VTTCHLQRGGGISERTVRGHDSKKKDGENKGTKMKQKQRSVCGWRRPREVFISGDEKRGVISYKIDAGKV